MTKKIKKKNLLWTGILSGIVLVFLGIFLLLNYAKPVIINIINPYIVQAVNPPDSEYRVQFKNLDINFPDLIGRPVFSISDIEVQILNHAIAAKCKKINTTYKFSSLLQNTFDPIEIYIDQPEIYIDKLAEFPKLDSTNTKSNFYENINLINESIQKSIDKFSDLEIVVINDIRLKDDDLEIALPSLRIEISDVDSGKVLNNSLILDSLSEQSTVDIGIFINYNNKSILNKIELEQFHSSFITDFFSLSLPYQNFSLSGIIEVEIFKPENKTVIDFNLFSQAGEIVYPEFWPSGLKLEKSKIKGQLTNKPSKVRLDSCEIILDSTRIFTKGNIDLENDYPDLNLAIEIEDLPVNQIQNYWPDKIESNTRQWIVNHITDGAILEAELKINVTAKDFEQKHLSKSAYDLKLDFTNLLINYNPPLPAVRDIEGEAYLNNGIMDFKIHNADVKNTSIDSGIVKIKGIGDSVQKMSIIANMKGPVEDISSIIDSLITDEDSTAQQLHASGKSTRTVFFLEIPELIGLPFAQMNSSMVSEMTNMTIPDFAGFQIKKGNVRAAFLNGDVSVAGSAFVNEVPVDIKYTDHIFNKIDRFQTINLNGGLKISELSNFNFPQFSFLDGRLNLDTEVKIYPSKTEILAKADLGNNNIDFKSFGWQKKAGEFANLDVKISLTENKPVQIDRFILSGEQFRFSGKGKIEDDFSNIINFQLDTIQFNQNELELNYSHEQSGSDIINITGNFFDANPIIDLVMEAIDDTTNNSLMNLNLTGNINKIMLRDSIELNDVSFEVKWDSSAITELNVQAWFPDKKNLDIHFRKESKDNNLKITSEDAGSLLKGLGLYPYIIGGELEFFSNLNELALNDNSKSKLTINWFKLKNAPTLATILSATSIVGTMDVLTNEGIVFRKLESNFEIKNNILTISEVKMVGPAIGLTAEGNYNLNNNSFDIHGTIIPFNMINGFFSRIPLLDLLVNDAGIIAVNYKYSGASDQTKISVNPLSIFTPGFTRNIFNIFNTKNTSNIDSTAN